VDDLQDRDQHVIGLGQSMRKVALLNRVQNVCQRHRAQLQVVM
jgi:hypothetical protein